MNDSQTTPKQQTATAKPWVFGCAPIILGSGIVSLFILYVILQADDYGKGGLEALLDEVSLGLLAFAILVVQIVTFGLGMIYLAEIEKSRRNLRGIIFVVTGMICSLAYGIILFLPRYLESRERERLPQKYTIWFPWVESSLKTYKGHRGEYPPALLPYLVPRFWEHVSAFPPDDYHAPRTQRYWHMNYGPHQWLDRGTTMPANVSAKDFDMTGYYRYYSDGKGYILIGNGPDLDEDLDARESFLAARRGDMKKLIEKKYDPTNGTNSGGDYWGLKFK